MPAKPWSGVQRQYFRGSVVAKVYGLRTREELLSPCSTFASPIFSALCHLGAQYLPCYLTSAADHSLVHDLLMGNCELEFFLSCPASV